MIQERTEHYPQNSLSIEQKRQWAASFDVATTPDGLILPNPDTHLLDSKIVASIDQAHERIAAAQEAGKYVIYLPGSYDLTHIGHLSFICQAINHCLHTIEPNNPFVTRDDLFVISLIDSDNLVRHTKRWKHVSYGGNEPYYRPIEQGCDEAGRFPRLDAVATLPVDCVGFLPAPTDEYLPFPVHFDTSAAYASIDYSLTHPKAREAVGLAIAGYEALCNRVVTGTLDFADWWHIELWQLYITLALTNTPAVDASPLPYQPGGITRLISADDFAYFDEVKLISHLAGIGIDKLADIHAHSTTQLIKENDPHALLARKQTMLLQR